MADLKDIIWQNCYDSGWQDAIVPEAYSHPAKFSRGLIVRIYDHARDMGWFKKGDWVLDPFAGVGLGAVNAMGEGLNWIGVELEEKFVTLGQQNIELWNLRLKGWPNLGTARIVRGDSRRLNEIIGMVAKCCGNTGSHATLMIPAHANLIISSPPFTDQEPSHAQGESESDKRIKAGSAKGRSFVNADYGHTPGNLANMKEGDIDLVVSSPPFSATNMQPASILQPGGRQGVRSSYRKVGADAEDNYGQSLGQLGSMKEGNFDLCISSPPYAEARIGQESGQEQCGHHDAYSKKKGQLGNMPEGSFDLCVSSPPWEKTEPQQDKNFHAPHDSSDNLRSSTYGKTDNQLGNSSGDTFWEASREIVQGCFDLLKPGGHAIWVTKNYVKKGKIVDFAGRWKALCESVGFKTVCEHQAMLVKSYGFQKTMNGEDKEIEVSRKSFFRRLCESKGSPKIDWEMVQCMIKE